VRKAACQILLSWCLVTVLGCAFPQESSITGKWVCKASGDRMELAANHTCTVYSMGFPYPGTWSVTKGAIKIDAGQVAMKGSFDGDTIVAEDAIMHNKYVYEKVVAP
jgi:hypothetical protein